MIEALIEDVFGHQKVVGTPVRFLPLDGVNNREFVTLSQASQALFRHTARPFAPPTKACPMHIPLKSALLALFLGAALLPVAVQAAPAGLKVSLLGGKLAFTLPAGYVKDEMPEIDAKARAEGVSGAMYTQQAEKRVLIVTETPIPVGVEASDDDAQVLDELTAAALTQQGTSYQNVQRLGEQRIVKDNGLGVRQLDASATLGGAEVLSTTLLAASGKRSAVLNVISSARNPAAHEAAVKAVIGR